MNKASKLQQDCCLITLFKILFATTDVLDDAHNTFLGNANDSDGEKETQISELNRGFASFDYSDDENSILQELKDKYNKRKRPNSKEKDPKMGKKKTGSGRPPLPYHYES